MSFGPLRIKVIYVTEQSQRCLTFGTRPNCIQTVNYSVTLCGFRQTFEGNFVTLSFPPIQYQTVTMSQIFPPNSEITQNSNSLCLQKHKIAPPKYYSTIVSNNNLKQPFCDHIYRRKNQHKICETNQIRKLRTIFKLKKLGTHFKIKKLEHLISLIGI